MATLVTARWSRLKEAASEFGFAFIVFFGWEFLQLIQGAGPNPDLNVLRSGLWAALFAAGGAGLKAFMWYLTGRETPGEV